MISGWFMGPAATVRISFPGNSKKAYQNKNRWSKLHAWHVGKAMNNSSSMKHHIKQWIRSGIVHCNLVQTCSPFSKPGIEPPEDEWRFGSRPLSCLQSQLFIFFASKLWCVVQLATTCDRRWARTRPKTTHCCRSWSENRCSCVCVCHIVCHINIYNIQHTISCVYVRTCLPFQKTGLQWRNMSPWITLLAPSCSARTCSTSQCEPPAKHGSEKQTGASPFTMVQSPREWSLNQ